jgi:hypothetical protein
MPDPVSIPMDDKFAQDAAWHAWHIVADSFKQGYRPRFGGGLFEHMAGKFGEIAFEIFCRDAMIPIIHTPLRRNYTSLNGNDDFIIEIMGKRVTVEVKTARINNPLQPDEGFKLFYNKQQYEDKDNHKYIVVFAGINKKGTQLALIGWLPATKIKKYPIRTDIKSPAYAIPVKDLKPMRMLVGGSE